jgi:hypothetical protein
MRQLLLAGLAGVALLATVPANAHAEDFYAGVGPFGVYVGPGYHDYGDWRWRHAHRYYGDDWRYRHYHRYYREW